MSGRVFLDYEDLNGWLADFAREQLTPKQRDLFAHEVETLKPLPPRDEAILCQVHTMSATKYGTVAVSRARYSVPDYMILKPVKIVISAFDTKIYRLSPSLQLVALHPRVPENTSSILLEHAISSLVRKPQAMVRWGHREILFPHPILRTYYSYLQKLLPYGAEAEFLKSLNLIHHVSLDDIIQAAEIIIETGSPTPFSDLKDLVLKPSNINSGDLARCQPPLNTELSQYDSLIPA